MAWKLIISSLFLVLSFGCYSTEEEIKAEIVDGFSTKLSSCSIAATELKDIKCDTNKGDMGNRGFPGLSGKKGSTGQAGPQGPQGFKGEKGDVGPAGLKGEPGLIKRGIQGPKGASGNYGIGDNGKKGTRGPTGSAGLAGTCPQMFELESGEDDSDSIGKANNPANFLCHTVIVNADKTNKTLTGDVWVFKDDKFKVRCHEKTKRTCLILKPQKDVYIQKNSINYKNAEQSFWLSNNNKYSFDLTKFFNNVTIKQITWLQSKSTQVTQKIKYHCKNSYVAEYIESALRLLSWNDLTIGPYTTNFSPLSYSLPPRSHACTEEAPKTEWGYSEIVVTGSSKRLPVVDFHIRDIRKEDQRFYLELTELCFG